MRRRALRAAWLAALLAVATPASAQYTEDDQTDDWSERDRRYLERLERRDAPGATDDEASRLEAFLSEADGFVRDRNYDAAASARYSVQTDDPRLAPERAAALLETFRDFFESSWPGDAEFAPPAGRSRVLLLYSFYEFNELLGGNWRRSTLRPAGHYGSTFDVITVHSDGTPPGELADSLVHEAAHQLIENGAYPGDVLPTWVSEGLATYYGHTLLDRDGRFRPGEIGGKALPLMRSGSFESGLQARARLRAVRQALKTGGQSEGPLVERVLAATDPARFYGSGVELHYAAAWMLVHFLLHGDDGAHAEGFVAWLDEIAAGGDGALTDRLGLDAAALDERFRLHVRAVDVTTITAAERSYRGSLSPSTTAKDAPGSNPATR